MRMTRGSLLRRTVRSRTLESRTKRDPRGRSQLTCTQSPALLISTTAHTTGHAQHRATTTTLLLLTTLLPLGRMARYSSRRSRLPYIRDRMHAIYAHTKRCVSSAHTCTYRRDEHACVRALARAWGDLRFLPRAEPISRVGHVRDVTRGTASRPTSSDMTANGRIARDSYFVCTRASPRAFGPCRRRVSRPCPYRLSTMSRYFPWSILARWCETPERERVSRKRSVFSFVGARDVIFDVRPRGATVDL